MEEQENIYFDYVDANGVSKKAEVLTLFTLEGETKEYALCSIPQEGDNYDITVFIVNNISPDEVSFDDITDPTELANVTEAAKQIMNG